MPAPAFIATVRLYWQKRVVRIMAAIVVLLAAIYLQYRLANIPLPVDVEKSKPPHTPAIAELARKEMLIIAAPAIDPSSSATAAGVLLSGDGTEFVSVEARFDAAIISRDFIDLLRTDHQERSFPNQDRQAIRYTAISSGAERSSSGPEPNSDKQEPAPCRTSIDIKLPEGASGLRELRMVQLSPGSDNHRGFEMEPVGGDVVVQLQTRNFNMSDTLGEMQGVDCGKTLEIGSWSRSFTAPPPINIIVPDGQSVRFGFTSAAGKMPWSGPEKSYEPFKLVALPLNAQSVKVANRALAITTSGTASASSSSAPAAFEAQSVPGKPPLVLKYFRVGSEVLQLDFTGDAMVQENGKYAVTFSLLDFVKGNPILAGILAMLDAALLEWIRRTLFKGSSSQ